jgi:hypothetical protein
MRRLRESASPWGRFTKLENKLGRMMYDLAADCRDAGRGMSNTEMVMKACFKEMPKWKVVCPVQLL